jgi:hypothetical protein
MIEAPSRVAALIQRIEAGNEPTADELRRVATLQALDLAKVGEDFVREMCQENERHTQDFKQWLDSI